MLINGALTCWNMNCPAIWRLHWKTHRMTDYVPTAARKKDVAAKRLLCTLSVCSQCLMVPVGMSKLVWYSSSLESRWMEPILPWRSSAVTLCCRIYVTSPASSSFFSRTVLRRTVLVRWCSWWSWTQDSSFHFAGFVAADQLRPQSNWLQSFGAWCNNESTRRKCRTWTIETASDWRVKGNGTRRYWRRHWRVAQTLHACVQAKGGHFEYSQWLVNLFNLFCENLSITFIVNQHITWVRLPWFAYNNIWHGSIANV